VEPTAEHDALRALVRDFAQSEIAPHAEAWDRDHHFPVDVVKAMGALGLFGLPFPEEYGGSGGDFTALCIAIEELARVDHSMAITLSAAVGLGASPIYLFGNEEQKQQWLPDLCNGTALAAFGLTESGGGSDAGSTKTRAVLEGDEWVIDGEKTFITNSGTPITSVVTITAVTGPGEVSTILVPAGTPGFTVDPPYRKMGWHASDTHGLSFSGCRVPATNLLGERGRGFASFLAVLDKGRIAISALAVGCIQACLDASVEYAKTRTSFGRAIGANQAVAFKCADLRVLLETSRHLTYSAAALVDAGKPHKVEAAIAKVHSTEAAVTATREATQIFGGYGFIDETPVARFYRDAKILEIGEGTSEIQRLVIARALGLPVS
jgi:short-chain 2-methylacyl-CoA dehydrogenase